jgi:hypothetical protein
VRVFLIVCTGIGITVVASFVVVVAAIVAESCRRYRETNDDVCDGDHPEWRG